MTSTGQTYLAGKVDEYFYPELGDPVPPAGADVHLLTVGGVCIRGPWPRNSQSRFVLGWAPLPKRNHTREAELLAQRHDTFYRPAAPDTATRDFNKGLETP